MKHGLGCLSAFFVLISPICLAELSPPPPSGALSPPTSQTTSTSPGAISPPAGTTTGTASTASPPNVTGVSGQYTYPNGKATFMYFDPADGSLNQVVPADTQMDEAWAAEVNSAGGKIPSSTPTGCTCGKKKLTGPGSCSPADIQAELDQFQEALTAAIAVVKQQYPGLGDGWWGNVTGSGPKCNMVSDALTAALDAELKGMTFKCIKPVTLFSSGWLPCDLLAHVFFGVQVNGNLVWCFDPWAGINTLVPADQCRTPDQIIPYVIPR